MYKHTKIHVTVNALYIQHTDVREHTRMLQVLFTYSSRIFIPVYFFCKKCIDAFTTYLSVLLLKIAILNMYNSISS